MIEPAPSPAPSCPAAASAPEPLRRKAYKIAGPQTWALAREFYLSGMPAPEVARRLDVSEHNLRRKAWKEGWSRRQHAERVLDVRMPKVGGDRSEAPLLVERGGAGVADEAAAAAAAVEVGGAAGSLEPPPEAPPLLAAGMLLRQAAAAALCGRAQAALEGVKLAESLARAARLLSDTEHGVAESRAGLLEEARQALEDDPDYTPADWHGSEAEKALDAELLKGLNRVARKRGRTPPQHLPLWFMLEDHEAHRPLAEALDLVVEGQAWVACPDFEAAVEAARAKGRGEAVDRALCTPVPWALCTWLSEEEKAVVAAREAQTQRLADEAAAEVASGLGWPEDEAVEGAGVEGEVSVEVAEAGPTVRRLSEEEAPWPSIRRRGPPGLSGPYVPLS